MSLPRTVELDGDGQLKFLPVEELKRLREKHVHLGPTVVEGEIQVLPQSHHGSCLEILAEFSLKNCRAREIGLKLRCSDDGMEETVLSYSLKTGELRFYSNRSDGWSEGIKCCKLDQPGRETLKLHIYTDTCTVEVYADEGRTVMSHNIFPNPESGNLKVFSLEDQVELTALDIWQLHKTW